MEARSLDTNEFIRMTPFFAELSPEAAKQAAAQVVTRRHPANQVILLENDWGNSVYFILEGWVKIRTYNFDGKEVTLNILGKDEVFGEMSCLEEIPRSTDVITLVPTVIGNLPAQDFVAGGRYFAVSGRWAGQSRRTGDGNSQFASSRAERAERVG